MTLKVRNQIFKIFMIASLALLAVSLFSFIFTLAAGRLEPLPTFRIPFFLDKLPFAKQRIVPTFVSFILLGLYVPIVLFFIFRYFENTQVSELIYFSAFLIGIICEAARFFTVCFGIWQTFTNLLIFLGNIVLFGRIIAPLSFVCAAIFSDSEQRQDIERNFMLMTVCAFIFAMIIPLNTAKISSAGLVTESSMFLLNSARVILVILSFFSFYVKSFLHANKDYISEGIWMVVLYLGYTLLISADNYLFMILGTGFLYAGTYFYLKTLHRMYMWI